MPLWPLPPQEDEHFDLESLLIPLDDVTMKEPPAKKERPDRKARNKKDAEEKDKDKAEEKDNDKAEEKDKDKALETVRGAYSYCSYSFICSRRCIAHAVPHFRVFHANGSHAPCVSSGTPMARKRKLGVGENPNKRPYKYACCWVSGFEQ